ncbi:Skp family chaperone for outer membrane proteins [Hydrogenophaga palleronii]|uniref:Skp family chaperone for outer membrane proteins n=1 Tax=Hydrogenophaga palleronii TaxID=65655 RepID=A0ABU1WRD9_9BURK|nr:CHAT domain-containing protein [Hydrogenophaga palleronii]MDR7151614.1 Skp family chaperone for outer membrane proteins [Hydrogenophaga palleronii]
MSLLEIYRGNVQRKREEISRLQNDKAKEQNKIADFTSKMQRASEAISRTKNISTIQSKSKEFERHQKDLSNVERKIADCERKIAAKYKELRTEEKRVAQEEEKESQKRRRDEERRMQENEKRMGGLNSILLRHDQLHKQAKIEIEKLKKLPEKIVVLFLAANPIDQQQLRLDEEARSIAEIIKKTRHRDSVKFESCWAVRPIDVLQALNEFAPAIVHFSGHGSVSDEIVFQDSRGITKLVSKEAIVQTMMASSDGIRLVFFNTCYSKKQAEAVAEHVEAAIGMNTTISDEAARAFSSQFYSSIGFGFSVQKSFDQAKALLMMEGITEEETPELFVKSGVDPNSLVIVKPNEVENGIESEPDAPQRSANNAGL